MTIALTESDFPKGLLDLGRFQLELDLLSWSVPLQHLTRIDTGSAPPIITLHFAAQPNGADVNQARAAMRAHDGLEAADEWADIVLARALGQDLTNEQKNRLFDSLLEG